MTWADGVWGLTIFAAAIIIGIYALPDDPEPRYYEDDIHTVDYDGHQFIVFHHSIIHHPECQCLH